MKSLIIAGLVFTTVALTSFLFYKNPPQDKGNIDQFSVGLSGIESFISPYSTLNIFCREPIVQQVLEARYVLFPVGLDFNSNRDTTLLILSAKDSTFQFSGHTLWHKENANFSFMLIKNFSQL